MVAMDSYSIIRNHQLIRKKKSWTIWADACSVRFDVAVLASPFDFIFVARTAPWNTWGISRTNYNCFVLDKYLQFRIFGIANVSLGLLKSTSHHVPYALSCAPSNCRDCSICMDTCGTCVSSRHASACVGPDSLCFWTPSHRWYMEHFSRPNAMSYEWPACAAWRTPVRRSHSDVALSLPQSNCGRCASCVSPDRLAIEQSTRIADKDMFDSAYVNKCEIAAVAAICIACDKWSIHIVAFQCFESFPDAAPFCDSPVWLALWILFCRSGTTPRCACCWCAHDRRLRLWIFADTGDTSMAWNWRNDAVWRVFHCEYDSK